MAQSVQETLKEDQEVIDEIEKEEEIEEEEDSEVADDDDPWTFWLKLNYLKSKTLFS